MKRNYYIFKPCRISRKENTVFIITEDGKKPLPIEDIAQLFIFGEADFNTKLFNFLAQNGVVIHIFNYYGYYSGSFYPREGLLSGFLLVKQVAHYLDKSKRLSIAKLFVEGAAHNMRRNLEKREFEDEISKIKDYEKAIHGAKDTDELMRIEAHIKKIYYSVFEKITGWEFKSRKIQPPDNPLNAMLSFGNGLTYAAILREIYKTPLNPTISYLHEPQERRFSLALDIAEIFKPILVDRLVFRLINLAQIGMQHFLKELNYSYLNEDGRKIYVKEFDKQLNTTLVHKKLRRKVKYESLILFELRKLMKHLTGEEEYKPLKTWW